MKNKIISLLNEISQKNSMLTIGFLGIGKTNKAILNTLLGADVNARIRLRNADGCALTQWKSHPRVSLFSEEREKTEIDEDLLFVSPSVRRELLNASAKTIVTSDTDIFFKKNHNNCFLISGSDGKSTVTTLTAKLLEEKYPRLFVGGNLGTPIADSNLDIQDAFVLELSSFNLRYVTPTSNRALITNITPNHLNWHRDFEEYIEAKRSILKHCREPIINIDTDECQKIANAEPFFAICSSRHSHDEIKRNYRTEHTVTASDGIYIDGEKILDIHDMRLRERHNLENFASAIAMTLGFVEKQRIAEVAKSFTGLEHRCEHFLSCQGIDFINSSIDTTPARTSATLFGLDRKVRILMGGQGKKLSLEPLLVPLSRYAEQTVLYGEFGIELFDFIENDITLRHIPHSYHALFDDAVSFILCDIKAGDTVILSPAATSYGEFLSFCERGARFKEIIRQNCKKI